MGWSGTGVDTISAIQPTGQRCQTQCADHDQRGRARVGVCDIGAVEYEAGGAFRLYLPVGIR